MSLQMSSSQTIGPYLHIETDWLMITSEIVCPKAGRERISIEGRAYDGNVALVADALIELRQADADGNYSNLKQPRPAPGFRGFGRASTDATGHFRFSTIMPGRVPGHTMQAPYIAVTLFTRGLLEHLLTRIYFLDGAGHQDDTLLNAVPVERRATLIAQPLAKAGKFQFDIVLQDGPGSRSETVLLDV